MQPAVLLAVAAAGALGAVARYLALFAARSWFEAPIVGIAVINVLGCFGFGCVWSLGFQGRWSPLVATAVLAGFFGAFTTFSSFAFDCHELWLQKRVDLLLLNAAAQNVLGFAAMWAGIRLTQG
ncbi:MAG: CrcB family protein [Planctomycetes bacterium]|nr:CrcB family protein [Planctomycetota bacterium]MCC7396357.1 CrcB family protein [Planctomycetota bacterium]